MGPSREVLDIRLCSIIIHVFPLPLRLFFPNFYLFVLILNSPSGSSCLKIQPNSLGRQRAKCALPVRPNSGFWSLRLVASRLVGPCRTKPSLLGDHSVLKASLGLSGARAGETWATGAAATGLQTSCGPGREEFWVFPTFLPFLPFWPNSHSVSLPLWRAGRRRRDYHIQVWRDPWWDSWAGTFLQASPRTFRPMRAGRG